MQRIRGQDRRRDLLHSTSPPSTNISAVPGSGTALVFELIIYPPSGLTVATASTSTKGKYESVPTCMLYAGACMLYAGVSPPAASG